MIDFAYLSKGLYGLANAHRANGMAGHLGAAVVAGYFFGEDRAALDDVVYRGVEGELDRVMRGEEAFWFNAKQAGITASELFDPLPEGPSRKTATREIADALAKNIGETRQSGHNVIFAAIAIRALHDHPEFATPAVTIGVRKLVETFNGQHAGRGYYGRETGWKNGNQVTLPPDDGFPPYTSEREMVRVVIDELIATAAVRKQGFGGLWHVVNHTAALTELSRLGFEDLARRGWPAHHHHVRLWRSLPDVEAELGPVTKSKLDPRVPDYWRTGELKRDEARLTHRIKTMYGFLVLLRFVEDAETRAKAEDAFLYLMS